MIRHLNLPGRPACLGLLLLLLGACSSNPPSTDKPSQQPAPVKPATPVTRPEPPPQPVEPVVSAHRQLLVKAESATDRGDYESALALLERAHRIDPDNGEIYLSMAKTHSAKGDQAMARATAERGLLYCDGASQCKALKALAR